MTKPQLQPGQHIHFIGIGGAGLSAIARILLERGYIVSGSDLTTSAVTAALAADGARVVHGHAAANVQGADLVLATSAVRPDHVEVAAAAAQGIPVFNRREFMAAVLQGCDTIAVAGTHGKTTTTSMIVHIMQVAGVDPSFIVGGVMGNTGVNAAVGAGESFVIEADEYDNMFHGVEPDLAVITNVEHDHPDFFKTPAQLHASFTRFVDQLRPGGVLVACADDEVALEIAEARRRFGCEVITYGISNPAADWRATELRVVNGRNRCALVSSGKIRAELNLAVPGKHNLLNALAALISAERRGVPPEQSVTALSDFKATGRRFEIRGERDGVIVVDDYAHHPTEIRVNIEAARLRYPGHQIWAIWQPHTYSRVQQFWRAFVGAFDEADNVMVVPIYAAREAAVAGVTSAALAKEITPRVAASFSPSFDDAVADLRRSVIAPAVVLIFSAGDANIIADKFLNDEAL